MLIHHARLGHMAQKHIYTKGSKIRFVSKYKWTSPLVDIVQLKKQQENHYFKKVIESLIPNVVISFEYSWLDECDKKV